MKQKLNERSTGLIVGAFVGLVHLLWAVLVATGYAQGWVDWIFALHFVENPIMVTEFAMDKAVMLVGVTAAVGFAGGYVFAWLWNTLGKKR
ncbi:MAG: hypothetical protein AAB803_03220 [Patescibacteria group bacterium]